VGRAPERRHEHDVKGRFHYGVVSLSSKNKVAKGAARHLTCGLSGSYRRNGV